MVQRSRIDKLPPEQRDRVVSILSDFSQSLDDVYEKVKAELDIEEPVSRSSLGRYRVKVERVAGAMRSSREAVKQLRNDLGDLSDDDQSRLNYEMVQEQCFRLLMAANSEDEEDATISVKDLRGLSDALYRLSASRKLDADRVLKIRQETAKETAQKAADVVVASIEKEFPGVSAAYKQSIYHSVLGVAKT